MAKQTIEIKTADGIGRASLFKPASVPDGKQPGVILYMDAFGPRPGLDEMAERLATAGYMVLLPDLFYRLGKYGPLDAKTSFSIPATRDLIMSMLGSTTQAMTRRDSEAFVEVLTRSGATGKLGTVGYCMGGGRALTAAAAFPDCVAAAASFHGGQLASDAADSPHLLAAAIKARVYVGNAGVDNSFPPEQSARLAQALRTAGVDYVIENYVGMGHGWAVPDHGVYNEAGAARHWKRLLTLFEETLWRT